MAGMNVMWIGLVVVVVGIAVAVFRFMTADNKPAGNSDLGTVSSSWLTENRSRKDP
jgi:hypothetical protein